MTYSARPAVVIISIIFTLLGVGSSWVRAADAALAVEPGDHITILGNTLAERMQFDGWLETLLHARFPEHRLVIRNIGYSGDELTLRLRSEAFGSPEEHLAKLQTDVVLAFFGFNESFAGPAGLEKFRKDLVDFIDSTKSKTYGSKGPARLVLFSPIAHEDLRDRCLPDGSANNANIRLYTEAMAAVARDRAVPFVDLFRASAEIYEKTPGPLTQNGIHLLDRGNELLAHAIDRALFGEARSRLDAKAIAGLREAVLDKCFHWFQRHRVVDGYSVYGGRSHLRFVEGQTNRVVTQRELEVLDVMTANRDARIWARARGEDLAVDDSNTPDFIPVKTNAPGKGPDGAHIYLGGEEAVKRMKVGEGLEVTLFASEERFPLLAKPVQMAFDARGRLFVLVMPSYPHWKPKDRMDDKVLILEDHDRDGRADECKVFAGGLQCPTGIEFWGGGLFVGQGPMLLHLKDTDGDDRADFLERTLHGVDTADTHHALNSFVVDAGGALYFQEGTFHHSQIETIQGPVRLANAGVFRYEARTRKLEVHVSYSFANPHGHVFDRWGQDFVTDGTGNVNYHASAFSGRIRFPAKHPEMQPFFPQRTRPAAATEILSSRHFPDDFQGNYLIANVIGFQGIHRYRIRDEGSSFAASEEEPLVESEDPNFRPVDIEVGPDGAVWFLDWQNAIIGHMQHNLRDPSRDHTHGRVYRITYKGRPLVEPPAIAGATIEKLLDLLAAPEDRTRYRARIELGARPTDKVIEAARKWLSEADPQAGDRERRALEALWIHQQHDVVNEDLLKAVLAAEDFRARAAAIRVLVAWRDRVPASLDLLKKLAADPYPRVRLEAVRAASFFDAPEAIEVPLISAEQPSDYSLEYARRETMRALEPTWKKALAEGRRVPVTSPAGARFFLAELSTEQVLGLDRDRAVSIEILSRKGIEEARRVEALRDLAGIEKKPELPVLLDVLRKMDADPLPPAKGVLQDLGLILVKRPPRELEALRPELEGLARSGKLPDTRRIGLVALVLADGSADPAWELARKSAGALADLAAAMPLIPDASLRAALYPRMDSLLDGLPPGLEEPAGISGRFIRIELPGRSKTLTLAEVEALSGGVNIARRGKATQKSTAHGGDPERAIDGNRSGSYGDGGQTHTEEDRRDPWWELDLGEEKPIEAVAIYNRTDGNHGRRLEGYSLKVLDSARREVLVRTGLAAPSPRAEIAVGSGGSFATARQAAMEALTHVRGQEAKAFRRIAPFAAKGPDREGAVRALLRIPPSVWPAEEAASLLAPTLARLRETPAKERTSPAALEALELAQALASSLPAEEARKVRKEIAELGVRVIRLTAVPHQMVYDKESIAAAAGKPVEIVFENPDLMPHNLVIARPGSLEKVGMGAEALATRPGALERSYVPELPEVLASIRLLQHRESEKLAFTAPSEPGVYPFVCTYPGHWRRMFGALYIVEDLDAYLADPQGYLTAHPLPIRDSLLELRRPRKSWKLEELAPSLAELDKGRSFGNGKQLLQAASCTACHKVDGAGHELGPDFTKLDPKLGPQDILKELLEPSFRIEEKYRAYSFVTASGRVVTGLVVGRTPEAVKVIENALVSPDPIEVKTSEILEEVKAEASIMPQGLLDQLTSVEVLDLLAYLVARGDRNHAVYKAECGHEPSR